MYCISLHIIAYYKEKTCMPWTAFLQLQVLNGGLKFERSSGKAHCHVTGSFPQVIKATKKSPGSEGRPSRWISTFPSFRNFVVVMYKPLKGSPLKILKFKMVPLDRLHFVVINRPIRSKGNSKGDPFCDILVTYNSPFEDLNKNATPCHLSVIVTPTPQDPMLWYI